jgi:hypothetical protein
MIEWFKSWRKAESLPFNSAFVPRKFDDLKDLEHGYWKAEDEAKDAVKKEAAARPSPTASKSWVDDQLERTCQDIGKFLAEQLNPLVDRIRVLEENQVTFGGTWKDGESYPEKRLVSFRGGLWLSRVPQNTTRPGEGPSWRLAVKSGDAK